MVWTKVASAFVLLGTLSGCADPAVWSAVAPNYQDGIALSQVLVDVEDMPEPARTWSEKIMADELARLGVTPIRNSSDASEDSIDAVLTMNLVSRRYVTIDVPVTYYPGETKITTYEKKGKTVTEIKERPGYHTGGYSYDVPVAQANFSLTRTPVSGVRPSNLTRADTIWTATTRVQGARQATWAALAVDLARRTIRQLGRDKVILLPDPETVSIAQR